MKEITLNIRCVAEDGEKQLEVDVVFSSERPNEKFLLVP